MRYLSDVAHPGQQASTLLILLPPAYQQPKAFFAQGFVSAVRERALDVDLYLAELNFSDIADLSVLTQLHHQLIIPARAQGYRAIWLAGISIGGYIATAYADRYPGHINGLLLLAPYPGSRIATNAIHNAGGIHAWHMAPATDDPELRNWHWLKTWANTQVATYLAYGNADRFAEAHAMMAQLLPEPHVDCIAGDHTWPVWQQLWRNFLDTHARTIAMDDTRTSPDSRPVPQTKDFNPAPSWRPTRFLQFSALVHVLALIAVITKPALWPWALAAVLLNHGLITLAGLLPRSSLLGANWTRLPASAAARKEVALTIDDGPNPSITPQVLDILERYQAKATFFCIGEKAARYPELCRDIVRRGHAVENHSQHHYLSFSTFGVKKIRAEVLAAQDTLESITRQRPQFFRAPAGLRNVFLDIVLVRSGLRLASWSVRAFDTKVGDAGKVLNTLRSRLQPGAILLLHDDNAARTSSDQPVILAVLPELLNSVARAQLRCVTLREAAR